MTGPDAPGPTRKVNPTVIALLGGVAVLILLIAFFATNRNGNQDKLGDNAVVEAALAEMITVARTDGNMIEPMLAAARAEATLGEICDTLRAEWGEYVEPARF